MITINYLTEKFSENIPGWVKEFITKAMKQGDRVARYNFRVQWDKADFVEQPIPDKWKYDDTNENLELFHLSGRVKDISEWINDSGYRDAITRLSDGSLVYVPKYSFYGDYTLTYSSKYNKNGKYKPTDRKLQNTSYQNWKPFVLDYGYIPVEYRTAADVQNARRDAYSYADMNKDRFGLGNKKSGQVKDYDDYWGRYNDEKGKYDWDIVKHHPDYYYGYSVDKSGYLVDKDKYKRMLAKLRSERNEYAEDVEAVKGRLDWLRKDVVSLLSDADIGKLGKGSGDYYSTRRDSRSGEIRKAYNVPSSTGEFKVLPRILNTFQAAVYEFNALCEYVNKSEVYEKDVVTYIDKIDTLIDEADELLEKVDW